MSTAKSGGTGWQPLHLRTLRLLYYIRVPASRADDSSQPVSCRRRTESGWGCGRWTVVQRDWPSRSDKAEAEMHGTRGCEQKVKAKAQYTLGLMAIQRGEVSVATEGEAIRSVRPQGRKTEWDARKPTHAWNMRRKEKAFRGRAEAVRVSEGGESGNSGVQFIPRQYTRKGKGCPQRQCRCCFNGSYCSGKWAEARDRLMPIG